MCAQEGIAAIPGEPLKTMLKRFCVVVILGIAFAYIEAAVVVYLREIFHPDGFTFPLRDFPISENWSFLLTEIGREAATLVLILTAACLAGRNLQQRFAYFMVIFGVWDMFYYIWLKILIGWPDSVMDWDILFLMPMIWASPVLAPVVVSVILLVFAIVILYRGSCGVPLRITVIDWLGFFIAAVVVIVSFCIAGLHIRESDFESHFHWPVFGAGNIAALALLTRCCFKSK